jgi:hypothetical protein
MSSRTILIETDALGGFAYERPLFGEILAIRTNVGDLALPNIVISDPDVGTIRTLTALAADDLWQPGSGIAVFGTLRVEVTGGGDTKHGSIRLLIWG